MANAVHTGMVLTAAAASANGSDLENTNHRGCVVVVDFTAVSGTTPTCVVTLEGKDPISGKYYTILASASLNSVATTVLRVFPAATAAANLVANDVLPRNFRVKTTIGGTTPSFTGTISVMCIAG
jgi:hypothetical protein